MSQIIIEEKKLNHNIELIKEKTKNITDDKGNPLKIIAVLKGNAYGIGVDILAKKLLDYNIDFFAVTEVNEALELRKKGFTNDILVLNSTSILDEVNEIVENDLIATIGSNEALKVLNDVAKEHHKLVKCHLKIDTGFCRFGFKWEDIVSEKINIKEELANNKNIKITGTYSHFRESYSDDDKTTRKQFDNFLNAIKKLKESGVDVGMLHICNSSAFFKYKEMYLNAVRIGSAFSGRLQIKNTTGLQRVGYLESRVCEVRSLKKGDKIGYSGTCTLKKDTNVAIVEAGYSDGIGVTGPKDSVRLIDKLRAIKRTLISLKENGTRYVEIADKKYPILGRIGMKNLIIDISNDDIKVGDNVKIDINLLLANQKINRILK